VDTEFKMTQIQILNNKEIKIKLAMDNRSPVEWPSTVWITGSPTCPYTNNFLVKLKDQDIKPFTVKEIKFIFKHNFTKE
jgi:hypothetical protein